MKGQWVPIIQRPLQLPALTLLKWPDSCSSSSRTEVSLCPCSQCLPAPNF